MYAIAEKQFFFDDDFGVSVVRQVHDGIRSLVEPPQ